MDIKKYLLKTLNDKEIIDLLPDKRVWFLHAINPKLPTYLEYEILDENGTSWAEGKEIATLYYIQIDIFSQKDYSELEKLVKDKMIESGFIRESVRGLWEEKTKLFHCAMRFNISGLVE